MLLFPRSTPQNVWWGCGSDSVVWVCPLPHVVNPKFLNSNHNRPYQLLDQIGFKPYQLGPHGVTAERVVTGRGTGVKKSPRCVNENKL